MPRECPTSSVVSTKAKWLLLLALILTVQMAHAELKWDQKSVQREVMPGAEPLEVIFSFTNVGRSTVTILSLQTSCSCTTASVERKKYAPGERGTLRAVFDPNGRSGPQEKSITVVTDDPTVSPEVLLLRIEIPPMVEAVPQTVSWARGEAPVTKEVVITAASDIDVRLTSAQSPEPNFTFAIVADAPGRRYRVQITPKSTTISTSAPIHLSLEVIIGRPEDFLIFGAVR